MAARSRVTTRGPRQWHVKGVTSQRLTPVGVEWKLNCHYCKMENRPLHEPLSRENLPFGLTEDARRRSWASHFGTGLWTATPTRESREVALFIQASSAGCSPAEAQTANLRSSALIPSGFISGDKRFELRIISAGWGSGMPEWTRLVHGGFLWSRDICAAI
jgi:hypothetical protein